MWFRLELFFLLLNLHVINSIKSENLTNYCNFKNKNSVSNYKSFNCDPISKLFIESLTNNESEEILCIYLNNLNGIYTNATFQVEGVRRLGFVSNSI